MAYNTNMAVIGMGCKFPGGCNNKEQFYEFLKNKGDGMTEPPSDRWNHAEWNGRKDEPGKYSAGKAGFISGIDVFDPLEFGISVKEAQLMDPSVRMSLEVSHEALCDSGIDYRGSNTGVFYAQLLNSAEDLEDDRYEINSYHGVGRPIAIRPNRISFTFDLRGQSIALDTACSSSATAMHLAMSAICLGDIDQALIVGGSTIINPKQMISVSKLGVLSSTGSSKSFDAAADGYARSEGFGAVLVKRLDAAIRDGDHIYSVISGSSINSNGKGRSLTMPEGARQGDTIKQAYMRAKRSPSDAFFVELHATGTFVGDPIEANAAGAIFSQDRDVNKILRIGSVKGNIGHTEGCSFLASLIKVSMMLHYKEIVPNIRFNRPNPKIDFLKGTMRVQTQLEPMSPDLAAKDGKWVTSISSFGVGGSNAHIVVESFDSAFQKPSDVVPAGQPPLYLFMAASFTESSLSRVQASIVEAFHGLTDGTLLRSLARDLARQSRSYHYTSFAVASSLSRSTLSFSKPTSTNATHDEKKLCLVFAGQGPQHVAMGRELAAIYPEFWKSILMSNDVLVQRFGKEGLLERTALFVPGKTASLPSNGVWPVADVIYSIVFFQIAIVDLIKSLGISYDFVIGHSIGEIAMGYASGHYNRETAIGIAVARATAMTPADRNGCMAALGVSVSKAKLMIEKVLSNANVSEGLWIAAVNSVNAVTVSGHEYLIDAIVALAATPTDKVFAAKLRVTCAFHSPLMETQEATFRSSMKNSALVNGTGSSPSSPTTARVMSSVDGNWLQRDLDADYCWDNIRRPVLFGAGINRIVNHCKLSNQKVIFLEIAPHPVLRSYIEEEGGGMPTISLVTRPNPKVSVKATGNHQQFLEGLGSLIGAGYKGVDFDRFYATPHGHQGYVKINFPLYPYNKTICWSESGAARSIRLQQPTKPLSGSHFRLSVDTHPELAAHHIFNTPLFPASGYIESILEHGALTVGNVQIQKPLALKPSGTTPAHVGCIINGNTWEFRSSTSDHFEAGSIVLDTVHASGSFSITPPAESGIVFDVSTKLSQSQGSLTGEQFYRVIPAAYNYRDHFSDYIKVIHEVADADSWDGTAYLAHIEYAADSKGTSNTGYIIHPGLLDSIMQTSLATFIDMQTKHFNFNGVLLPVNLDALTRYDVDFRGSNEGGLWVYCWCRTWAPEGPFRFNFIVSDMQGHIVLTLDGLKSTLAPAEYSIPTTDISPGQRLTTVWQPKIFPAVDPKVLAFPIDPPFASSTQRAHLGDVINNLFLLAYKGGRHTARIADLYPGPELADCLSPTLASLSDSYQFTVDYHCIASTADAADNKAQHLKYTHGKPMLLDDLRQDSDIRVARFDVVILAALDLHLTPLNGIFDILNPGGFVFLVIDEVTKNPDIFLQELLADDGFTHDTDVQVLRLVSGSVILFRRDLPPKSLELESTSQFAIHHFSHGNEGDLVNTVSILPAHSELWILGNDDASGIGALGLAACLIAENELHVHSLLFEDYSIHRASREAAIRSLRRKPCLLEQHMKLTRSGDLLVRRLVPSSPTAKILTAPTLFNSSKSYILVGGSSELGVQLVNWMAKNGARHLVLTSRRGPTALTKVDRMHIQYLRLAGLKIDVVAANATSHHEMATIIKQASEQVPIGGVFMMTVVLRDAKFTNLLQDSFDDVYDSKVVVLNTLLACIRPETLDFLLLFSTISSVFGNAGQAAYCAAQLYLDRIADTLPNTISLSFPPITDTGIFKRLALSTQGRATRELTKIGMPMAHVCNFIGDALICQMPHYVPMLSIDAVPGVLPHCEPLLYAHLLSTRLLNEKRAAFSQLAAVITPASLLADIVGLQPDQITEDALVKSFGLDSLGATRYSNQLIAHCEIQVSQIELLETMTVGMLNSMKATTWSEAQNDPEDTIYKDGSHLSRLLLDDTQHEGEHLYDPSLVAEVIAINKGGTTPRLFIVHDATGMTSPFLNLGLFLPNQICAIGDRQYGTSNGPSSIDSMAEHYISIIRAIQPHGPFVISGYSFGGIVALSIASKLANAGETVIRLILFDTYFVSGVRELESSYSFEWAQRVIDAVVAHFPPMSQEQEQELRVEIWKNTRLMSHHDPEFYDGPTTLITPEDHSWYTGNAPLHVEWRQRLSNLDLKVSAGRHDTMFAAKHVETLAITLKDILSGM